MRVLTACFCGVFRIRDVKAFWKLRDSILSLRKRGKLCRFLAKAESAVCTMIRRRYGAGIPVSENVQPFVTPHGFHGIFISKYATVEEGCTIYQQVTIGQNSFIDPTCEGGNAPVVGKNCYIGVGAKIIGPCHVGENVRIGANAIVIEDIPENATVVLHKPRIIVREKDSNS